MHTVTKIFTFDTGHRLSNYEGKCKRLHGHTYKLELTVTAEMLDNAGMVLDFNELKEIFNETIDSQWDHRTLLFKDDEFNKTLIKHDSPDFPSFIPVPYNPTAENMAKDIFYRISGELPRERGLHIEKVKLYETPTSYAEFDGEEQSIVIRQSLEKDEGVQNEDANKLTDEQGNEVELDEHGKLVVD